MNPAEAGAAGVQRSSEGSEEAGEDNGEDKQDNEDIRVEPYVDFTDFYRQVAELGEDVVYGWDKEKTEAAA